MKLEANIVFQGQCQEAFEFYENVLGGTIVFMLTYENSPMADQLPPDWGGKVAHATLKIGEADISGADALPENTEPLSGFYFVIHPIGLAASERVFRLLTEGGEVTIPLQKTFFSPGYGIVKDRFGVSWKVNTEDAP